MAQRTDEQRQKARDYYPRRAYDATQRDAAVRRLRTYNLGPGSYARLLAEQGGLCAICQRKKRLHVDHNHQNGVVRGLLCHNCNATLGLMGDNPDLLGAAIAYLIQWQAIDNPQLTFFEVPDDLVASA